MSQNNKNKITPYRDLVTLEEIQIKQNKIDKRDKKYQQSDVESTESNQLNFGNQVEVQQNKNYQLFLKNKINQRNSFEIPLINLNQLPAYKEPHKQESWKKMSAGLDLSSKIYGLRVDNIFQSTLNCHKMINFLYNPEFNKEIKQNTNEQLPQQEFTKKQSQLEKEENLSFYKFDFEIEVDPFFQKHMFMFDEAGVTDLLLNNLDIDSTLQIVLDQPKQTQCKCYSRLNLTKYQKDLSKLRNMELIPELKLFKYELQKYSENYDWILANSNNFELQEKQQDFIELQIDDENQGYNEEQNQQNYQAKFNLQSFNNQIQKIGKGMIFQNQDEKSDWLIALAQQTPKKSKKSKKTKKSKKNNVKQKYNQLTNYFSDAANYNRRLLNAQNQQEQFQYTFANINIEQSLVLQNYCQDDIKAFVTYFQKDKNIDGSIIEYPKVDSQEVIQPNDINQDDQYSNDYQFINNFPQQQTNFDYLQQTQTQNEEEQNFKQQVKQKIWKEINRKFKVDPAQPISKEVVSLGFVLMLHIANDNECEISQLDSLDDCLIKKINQ